MGYSEPRQNFGSTSPLFSRYTSRRGERVSGEQHGGEAETLSRIRADYGTNLVYASTGCPKKWTIQNRYGYTYAKIAYFQPYPFRTGDA